MSRFLIVFGMAFLLLAPVARAGQDVVNTRHNLSVSGPGTIKSATITQVCVFCHTPHNALPDAQLWNHLPTAETNYIMYDSSTLKTAVLPADQPTGKSRLCLACHDGTIALGALQNPPNEVTNDLASTLITGRGDLTTDLSNDHPISFSYDAALFGTSGAELLDPSGLAAAGLPLEGDQLQCTTCHDPHEKDLAPFLRLTTADGTLCITCHDKTGWVGSTHQSSSTLGTVAAADLDNRRPEWVQPTVAGNACLSCHTPHNAVNAERLIAKDGENTCYGCHDGTPASDIQGDFAKLGGHHPVELYPGVHDATKVEIADTMPLHVECMDCHNPHTVTSGALPMVSFIPATPSDPNHMTPPTANALIQDVTGINLAGNATTSVTDQYELCFKCHGRTGEGPCGTNPTDRCSASSTYTRKDGVYNIRDKIHNVPAGGSWHPLVTNNSANDGNVPSLRTDIPLKISTIDKLIYCTDCHNSDTSVVGGGTGPNGPHGSANAGLLANTYELNADANGSAATSQLCFNCHDEAIITTSTTTGFTKHGAHLGNRQGSCMKCHDPHGSNINSRLINFLMFDGTTEIMGPVKKQGQWVAGSPYWVDTGDAPDTGECWLSCHGTGHSGKTY